MVGNSRRLFHPRDFHEAGFSYLFLMIFLIYITSQMIFGDDPTYD